MFEADTVLAVKEFFQEYGVSKFELVAYGLLGLIFWRLPEFLKFFKEMWAINKDHDIKAKKLDAKIQKELERRKQKRKR